MEKIEDKDIELHINRETLLQEYIPKADYENRLKADLKAIFVELQMEIEEMDSGCGWEGYRPTAQVLEVIQQKINALKENDNGFNEKTSN